MNDDTALRIDLSIIIPAYNEEYRLGKTLELLSDHLQSDEFIRKLITEVVIVIPDSSDSTLRLAQQYSNHFEIYRILRPGSPKGKGRDVQLGVLAAKGAYVLFMDADLATPLKYISKFYNLCLEGNEIVIGTRNLKITHPSLFRRVFSNVGNVLFKIVSGIWLEDSQCGFKMFDKISASLCFKKLTIMSWSFDMEVLVIARSYKMNILPVKINDWKSVKGGSFDRSLLSNYLTSMRDLILILRNRVTGKY